MKLEHVSMPEWPNVRDGSFASRIATNNPTGCVVALLGMPDDTGVMLNHGNPGAAGGPRAFREALARYGAGTPHGFAWPAVFDAGDIEPGCDIDTTHKRVTCAVIELVSHGMLPVGIGGGHDLTFPFVRGVAAGREPMSGIYLDAHLDVRDAVGSGMPFRRLVEDCGVTRLDVIGLDRFANSKEHAEWFASHGGHVDLLAHDGDWPGEELFVSIDLDAIDAAHAPGVSARNPNGMAPSIAAAWAEAAGRCDRVRCFDLMELCPARDHDGRTARLAAHLFLSFLSGLACRGGA